MGSCIWRAGTITSRGRPGSCTSASGRYWRGSAVALPRVSGTAFSRDRPRAGPSGGLRGPGGPPERRQVDPSQPARGREDGHRLAPAADDTDTDHRHQAPAPRPGGFRGDRKSTRLNSSHSQISYAVFCLKKKKPKHDVRCVCNTTRYHRLTSLVTLLVFSLLDPPLLHVFDLVIPVLFLSVVC